VYPRLNLLTGVSPRPAAHGRWKGRSARLCTELVALDSDVLAMQEVDEYDTFWAPWLKSRGYGGIWKQRTQMTAGDYTQSTSQLNLSRFCHQISMKPLSESRKSAHDKPKSGRV